MNIKQLIIISMSVICSSTAFAANEFDIEKFVSDLNNEIGAQQQGVRVIQNINTPVDTNLGLTLNVKDTASYSALDQSWAKAITKTPQDFAVVAVDSKGTPIDIFGASTPFEKMDGNIAVPGYKLPAGGSFKTVGAAGWAEAAIELASAKATIELPNKSIKNAVDTIAKATDYIAQQLCTKQSRPTKLVLNLNAGFELVFNAKTGSQVEWDLEVVCKRK